MGHYIENTGDEPLRVPRDVPQPRFADISLSQWMANTPPQVAADTLNLSRATVEGLPHTKPRVTR